MFGLGEPASLVVFDTLLSGDSRLICFSHLRKHRDGKLPDTQDSDAGTAKCVVIREGVAG